MTADTPRRGAALASWAVFALVLFAMPTLQQIFGFAVFNLIFLYFVFFWVTQATSWNIFCGYSGYFSFGQAAFYGSGLYVAANLDARYGASLLPALPLAGLVGGLIALLIGLLVFRLRKLSGEIFGLFTLAASLALGSLANNWEFIDGGRGIPINQIAYPEWLGTTTEMLYYLGLVLALASIFIAYAIQHSRAGFGLFAIRDDERVAESIGVPTFRYKLTVLTLNGVISAMSGALHAVQVNFISPATAYGITVPLFVILMSVLGGRRHWSGPIFGAVLIYTVTDRLTGLGYAEVSQLLLAVVLIAATLFVRSGIAIRVLQRPVPPTVAGLAVFLVLLLVTDAPVITDAAIGMIVAMLVLFIPEAAYARVSGRRPPAQLAAEPETPEEPAVTPLAAAEPAPKTETGKRR